jgi:hypothetical protein
MQRRISLLVSLTLSFLMIFSPLAIAEEIKIPISENTSKSGKLEIIKLLSVDKNNTNFLMSEADNSTLIIKNKPIDKSKLPPGYSSCIQDCGGGRLGDYYMDNKNLCVPCMKSPDITFIRLRRSNFQ